VALGAMTTNDEFPHTSPDPIADPQGYQRHLLELLGDDDPAAVQTATPREWHTMIDVAGAKVHLAPAEGEWSVFGCLAHAVDAEIVMSARYRWILAHDEPPLLGYDQDLWVQRLHADPDAEPSADLLAALAALRRTNLALWRRSTERERARVGVHDERGPESFDLSFRMIAGHDRFHLRQARETLEALAAG
ncbi:MAG: DinB family protein, partial [Actinomycetota bacterium]|nr:DinB family protein [Actinomycetota bacterium]